MYVCRPSFWFVAKIRDYYQQLPAALFYFILYNLILYIWGL